MIIHCISYSRIILYIAFFISLALMFADLLIGFSETSIFYVITNAILVYRVIGVYFYTTLLHVICMLCIFLIFYSLDWGNIHDINAMTCFIPFLAQFILSLHLLCMFGCKPSQKACMVGIHAFLGLVVVVIFFWVCVFLAQDLVAQSIIQIAYMLLFLIMVLTPQFLTDRQAVKRAATDLYICQQLECYMESEDDESDRDYCPKTCHHPPARKKCQDHSSKPYYSDCEYSCKREKKPYQGRRCCSQEKAKDVNICPMSNSDCWGDFICKKPDVFTANPCCQPLTIEPVVYDKCSLKPEERETDFRMPKTYPSPKHPDYDKRLYPSDYQYKSDYYKRKSDECDCKPCSSHQQKHKPAQSEVSVRKRDDDFDADPCNTANQLRKRKPAKSESNIRKKQEHLDDDNCIDDTKRVASEKFVRKSKKDYDMESCYDKNQKADEEFDLECLTDRKRKPPPLQERSHRRKHDDSDAETCPCPDKRKHKSTPRDYCSDDNRSTPRDERRHKRAESERSSKRRMDDVEPDDRKHKSRDRSPECDHEDRKHGRDRRCCSQPAASGGQETCPMSNSDCWMDFICKNKPDVFTANPCCHPLEIEPEIPDKCSSKPAPDDRRHKSRRSKCDCEPHPQDKRCKPSTRDLTDSESEAYPEEAISKPAARERRKRDDCDACSYPTERRQKKCKALPDGSVDCDCENCREQKLRNQAKAIVRRNRDFDNEVICKKRKAPLPEKRRSFSQPADFEERLSADRRRDSCDCSPSRFEKQKDCYIIDHEALKRILLDSTCRDRKKGSEYENDEIQQGQRNPLSQQYSSTRIKEETSDRKRDTADSQASARKRTDIEEPQDLQLSRSKRTSRDDEQKSSKKVDTTSEPNTSPSRAYKDDTQRDNTEKKWYNFFGSKSNISTAKKGTSSPKKGDADDPQPTSTNKEDKESTKQQDDNQPGSSTQKKDDANLAENKDAKP